MTWCRGGMPSHSSSSSAPSVPQTQAVAHDVVGRRTPTADSSRPVSALNVEDLPEPVAPAIATTVWSAESRSRLAARSTTSLASSTSASSSRPRAASAAASSASMRAPRSEPRVTSLVAPSSKDVMFSLGVRGRWRVDGCDPARSTSPASVPALPGVAHVVDPTRRRRAAARASRGRAPSASSRSM